MTNRTIQVTITYYPGLISSYLCHYPDHTRLHGTTPDHTEPQRDHTGPNQTTPDHMSPHMTTRDHTGQHRIILDHTGAYKTIGDSLYWAIQSQTVPDGARCGHTGPYEDNLKNELDLKNKDDLKDEHDLKKNSAKRDTRPLKGRDLTHKCSLGGIPKYYLAEKIWSV